MKSFKELGIMEPILKSIEEQGFDRPTEIQEQSIPIILEGQDIIAGSATGSGKTLAFSCGIIHRAEKGKGIQAIVLTPTRELAEQVCQSMKLFSKYEKISILPIYGGVSINPQIEKLKNAEVVVGTPGRVLDHISRGTMNLRNIKVAVLDEADRMLDMGFIDDVKKILGQTNSQRQTLLYSATITDELAYLSRKYMKNPIKVSVVSYVDPKKLKQIYYDIPMNLKFSLLVHLLRQEQSGLVMVFCNTQRVTDFVARNLQKQKIRAIAIHGGLTQAKRTKTMERFNNGNVSVLVCTDVAARGLHIEGVSHVYNYDIPRESKQYIHRIGRTARAGKEGIAISILTSMDHDNFSRVLNDFDVNIIKLDTPKVERIMIGSMNRKNRGNFSRGRQSFGKSRFKSSRSKSKGKIANPDAFGRSFGRRKRNNFRSRNRR